MTSRKRNIIVVIAILVIIVIGAVFILPKKDFNTAVGAEPSQTITLEDKKDIEQQEKENMQETLLLYADYGITYDAETQKVYYNGRLVRKFTDGKLIYIEQADGTVEVTAIRDIEGSLTGLEVK